MTAVDPQRLRAFITQVDTTAGPTSCWPWRGHRTEDGYARFGGDGDLAHRVAYELMRRPIPAGLVVDHTCHNADADCPGGPTCLHRRCINPAHLEAVRQGDNVLRSRRTMPHRNAAKTHCPQGHAYDDTNTRHTFTTTGRQRRDCRACGRERTQARDRRRKSAAH
jgi:hypothetical protein